ncbi:MAG: Ppx/GppA family phosphatase [Prevotella sp.]|jgi:exopolyphosphatase/guanosine-5'-triphosphate,3'-diphosphate pyrophosphatase
MKKTLASIDIGSNGARLLIKKFNDEEIGLDRVKKLMFIRVPLRLGKDVFSLGKVSKEREKMMIHMMKAYKHFMKLFDVDDYRACATSAMRDAENGMHILRKIKKETGIKLEIVKGSDEAILLVNNLVENTDSDNGNFAYVDVGGGSTEISLIHEGALTESHSYNIGTLRLLSGQVSPSMWKKMENDLQAYARKHPDIQIIGSGGNINKLFRISNEVQATKTLSIDELRRLYGLLKPMSLKERMEAYGLKDDRADVIVPAAEIFLNIADQLKSNSIFVPNISLADSIVDGLYRELRDND